MYIAPSSMTNPTTASAGADALAAPVRRVLNQQTGMLMRHGRTHFFGFWNVRSLMHEETQALTMHTLSKYNIDIACLSEARLPDSGYRRIKVPQHDASYHLYHSGPTDNSGLHGVAFALNDRANASFLAWEPISPRLAHIRLRGSAITISVIVVYAPILSTSDEDKDFYDALQAVVDRIPASDILIVAGDWNARTGPSNTTNDHILGRFAIGNQCANGERLVNFAAANHLTVSTASSSYMVLQ
ncbi:Hypothetical predicted protein [Octopus vulgaris]|uniref:Endonuclease/exonuclease/phosphatase domain-containing protein n=1 Tax=Octopus vulgaris TaxID=6645 RepID=A0AA36B8R1_OCTVU|nr:Hypothetical predicted protein [Octopus vulgaris]